MITLAYFINRLRNNTIQNLGSDLYEDIDWVYQINTALLFFSNYMCSNGPWYFANIYHTTTSVDPLGDTTFTTDHTIGRLFKVMDLSQKIEIKQNNVAANFHKLEKYAYSMTAGNQITINTPIKDIGIWYQRLPTWHNYLDLEVEIDIPREAIGVLEFLVQWRTLPVNLEQGAQLANNYYEQAKESMKVYAQNIGYTNSMKGMITPDQFNNEQSISTRNNNF